MFGSEREIIFFLADNIFSIYLTVRLLDLFMEKGSRNVRLSFLTGFIYWTAGCLCLYIFNNKNLNLAVNILGMLLVTIVPYREKIWKKLLAVLLVFAIRVAVEDLLWLFLHVQAGLPDMMVSTIQLFLLFLLEILLEKIFVLKEEIPVPGGYYFCMLLMPMSSIVLTVLLIEIESMIENRTVIILSLTMLMIMNFSMLFFFDSLMKILYSRWQNQFLEGRVEMYENQLQILSESREKVHSLRHDLKNHLHLVTEFVKSGRKEELLAYLEDMDESMSVEQEIVRTGNEEVDAILNYMLEKARRAGARISLKLNVPKTHFCPVFDLNILLSNLLDNAVEALAASEEKILMFRLELEKGVLCLEVKNSFSGRVKKQGGHYLTLKEEKEYHGMGLTNARRTAEKYGGTLAITHQGGFFCVSTVLLLGEI